MRTLKPFAFGQLKEVYLMKKIDNFIQNEAYVIKMHIGDQTYKTMNEALLECRSHLISKRFMQKFIQSLNDNGFNAPLIKYSDFLILKEHESQKTYQFIQQATGQLKDSFKENLQQFWIHQPKK